MAENHCWHDFVAGAVVGGLIGAGIALLFAPASGKEELSPEPEDLMRVVLQD